METLEITTTILIVEDDDAIRTLLCRALGERHVVAGARDSREALAIIRRDGVPDLIIWSEGRPLWVVELKTTKGDPTPLWPDQENQVRIYGLLLDRMGFDCSRMRLAVVRLKSDGLTEEEKREWILRVSKALLEGKVQALEGRFPGKMKVHLLRHEVERAENAVATRAGYWLDEREPTSSSSVGRCRACEYSSSCQKSLFKPRDDVLP